MKIEEQKYFKKKVLILYNKLFHYRIPIFNILAQKYDLTVIYSYKTSEKYRAQCNFNTKYIPIIQIGKFVFHKTNIVKFCKNFDVIIAYGQPTWLSYSTLALHKRRKFKLLFWGIGAPASYKRQYGKAGKLYFIFNDFFDHKADGLIFYSDIPKEMHKNRGYPVQKIFVANNTVEVTKINPNTDIKANLLFIGTLYLEKGIGILLEAYLGAYKTNNNIPKLYIIGGGEQFERISEWIKDNCLTEKIYLLGPIYDKNIKAELFSKAIACISPLQAGLSVLESMGYGVPYITMEDAVTGGEAFNIQNNVNGLRLKSVNEFEDVILDIFINKAKYIQFGINAYNHYWNFRKPEDMANGIIEAIENV